MAAGKETDKHVVKWKIANSKRIERGFVVDNETECNMAGRSVEKINLGWKFFRGDEPNAWYKGFDDSGWQDVTLPHDWSVAEPFSKEHSSGTGYLPGGVGWYRKTFFLPERARGKKIYVTFEGIYNNSQVWCNSYYLGKRPYGYSTFTYDVTDFAAFGDVPNVISVRVDHKNTADSRWFTGSGIYRDVYIMVTDRLHFDNYGIFATTPEVSAELAVVNVDIKLSNETGWEAGAVITASILDYDGNIAYITSTEGSDGKLRDAKGSSAPAGLTVPRGNGSGTFAKLNTQPENCAEASVQLSVPAGKCAEVSIGLILNNPKLWSPDSPNLYTMAARIYKANGELADNVEIPIGIRSFVFDPDKGFFLNGKNMKIKGVCVHHDAGCLGAAVPEKVWAARLRDLKEMGCNAIRTSHNPPAPYLLDLCDRMGFLVMDEAFDEWEGVKNKWWNGHNVYPPKHYGYYEDFPQWCEADIKEMVLRDRNHPSVIMWSIGNEVDYPNDPYCHPSFSIMTGNNDENKPAAERVYDPNRPNAERLTAIAKRLVKYVKECDVTRPVTAALAFPELSNLTGYSDTLDVAGYNYKEHLYKEDHEKYPNRVIYGSENRSSLDAWLAVRDNDYICGQFIWTGVDYLGEAKGWPIRASQPGFLDLAGYKKTGYYYRQSLWTSKPTACLAVRRKNCNPDASDVGGSLWEPQWNWNPGEVVEAACFTNCEEAELYINGKSAGIRRLREFPGQYIVWEVEFEEGTIGVVAKSGDGQKCACELKTTSTPDRLAISSDTAILAADGQDIALLDIRVEDEDGLPTYHADNLIRLSIEGPGEILGLENGDASDLEPYCSKQRKAYHGKLRAYIRAKTTTGQIIVRAEAQGLKPASIAISAG